MKLKIAIVLCLLFNTISPPATLAETNQSQPDPNEAKPPKPHLITFEDNGKFKTVGSPQVSKDGKWVAYTLSDQVWVVPIKGGEPRAVTTKGSSAWNPV